jgi:hypothetical protein
MKPKLYLLAAIIIALCGTSFSAEAQVSTCKIFYNYDAAGNRIKRYYDCPPQTNPWDEPVTSTTIRRIYPNPTTGVINVEFYNPINTATFFITDISGNQILRYDLTQLTSIVTLNITPQVPGTYLLTVLTGDDVESYPITKL